MSVGPSWNCGTDPYPGTSALESTSSPACESTSSPASESTSGPARESTSSYPIGSTRRPTLVTTISHIPEEKELDPSCSCGAGTFLGTINSIPMYDNHKVIECILNPEKPKITYLKQEYFDILQEIELFTKDPSLNYVTKITKLLQIWKNCSSTLLLHCNPCFGIHTFLHFAVSESAVLILQLQWEKIEEQIKNQFVGFVELIIPVLKNIECIPEVLNTCQRFLYLLRSPWHYAPMPHYDDIPTETTNEDFLNLVTHEKSIIIVHRLKVLLNDTEQTISAMKFAYVAVKVYEEIVIKNSNQTFYREEDYEYIRDTLYILFESNYRRRTLINIFKKKDPKDEGKKLIRSFYKKIKYLSTLQKNYLSNNQKTLITICEMGSAIMVMNSVQKYYDASYEDYSEIMRYWINILFLLSESDLFTNMNKPFYQQIIVDVFKSCYTADHVYTLFDIFYDKFGSKIPKTFYLSTFIRGLTMNVDEKLYRRCHESKEKIWLSVLSLKHGYLKLSKLLEDLFCAYRECVLSAYCILPDKDLMDEIENIAIKSGKLVLEDSTNVPWYYIDKIQRKSRKPYKLQKKNTQIHSKIDITLMLHKNSEDSYSKVVHELENLQPEPLTKHMIECIVDVLSFPRMGSVDWNMQWSEIKTVCQQLMDDIDIVLNRNLLKVNDLQFLHVDIREHNLYILEKRKMLGLDKDNFSYGISSEDEESNKSNSSGDRVYFNLDNSKSQRQRKSKRKIKKIKPKTLRARIKKESKKSNSKTRLTGKKSEVETKGNSVGFTLRKSDKTNPYADPTLEGKNDCSDNNFKNNTESHLCMAQPKLVSKSIKHNVYHLSSKPSSVSKISKENDSVNSVENDIENIKSNINTTLEKNKNTIVLNNSVGLILEGNDNVTTDDNFKNNIKLQPCVVLPKRVAKRKNSTAHDSLHKTKVIKISKIIENVNPGRNDIENINSSYDTISETIENVIADNIVQPNITDSVGPILEVNDNIITDDNLEKNIGPQQNITEANNFHKRKAHINFDLSSKLSVMTISKENENITSINNDTQNINSSVDTFVDTNENGTDITFIQNVRDSVDSIFENPGNTIPQTNQKENYIQFILEKNITIDGNFKSNTKPQQNIKKTKRIIKVESCTFFSDNTTSSVHPISAQNVKAFFDSLLEKTDNNSPDTNLEENFAGLILEENDNTSTDTNLNRNTIDLILEENDNNSTDINLNRNTIDLILEENDNNSTDINLNRNTIDLILEENDNVTTDNNLQKNIKPQQNIQRTEPSVILNSRVNENVKSCKNILKGNESTEDSLLEKIKKNKASKILKHNVNNSVDSILEEPNNTSPYANFDENSVGLILEENGNTSTDTNLNRNTINLILEENDNVTTDNNLQKNIKPQQNIQRTKPSVILNSRVNEDVKSCKNILKGNESTDGSLLEKIKKNKTSIILKHNVNNSVDSILEEPNNTSSYANFNENSVGLILEENDNTSTDTNLNRNNIDLILEENDNISTDINLNRNTIDLILEENDNVTTDNNLQKNTKPQQNIQRTEPSVILNSRVNENVKSCKNILKHNVNSSVGSILEEPNNTSPYANFNENSVGLILEENGNTSPDKNFKKNTIDLILEGNDNKITDNNLKKKTEPQPSIKRTKRIIKVNKCKDFHYSLSKRSVPTTSQANKNIKSGKNVLENDASKEGSILEKIEIDGAGKVIAHNLKRSADSILERNDNITTENNLKKKTEPQPCIKRTKRIIKVNKCKDFHYSSSKPSVNINSQVNDNVKSYKNVLENDASSVDTYLEKKNNSVAGKAVTRNNKILASSILDEIGNTTPNRSLKRNAVGLILERNDNITTDKNLKKNNELQPSIKRTKRIIKINKCEDFHYSLSKPSVGIKSQINKNVKSCKNVLKNETSTVGSTLEVTNNTISNTNLQNNSKPQQNIKRSKRIIKSNKHEDFHYSLSKHSVHTPSQANTNIKSGKNVLKNAKGPVDHILGKSNVTTDNKYNTELKATKIKRLIKTNKNDDYEYPLSKGTMRTASQENYNVNSDNNILENNSSSNGTVSVKDKNVVKNVNWSILKENTSASVAQRINRLTKRVVRNKTHQELDNSPSRSRTTTKRSLNSISKKNKKVKTSKNDTPQQVAKKRKMSVSILEKNDTANTDSKRNTKRVGSILKENESVKTSKNKQENVFQHKIVRPKRLIKKKQYNEYVYSVSPRTVGFILEKNDNTKAGGSLKGKARLSVDSNTIVKEKEKVNSVLNIKKDELIPLRAKRSIIKTELKEYDYSVTSRKTRNSNKTNCPLNSGLSKDRNVCSTTNNSSSTSTSNNLFMNNESHDPYYNEDHLNNLRQQMTQLSSIEYMIPKNTDHIVNVVQIQITSNPLTNVSQTQTEHISNHSNNEIEKKTNNNQTNTHSLDNFVSLYQSNSLNNNINSIQDSGIQGECSFTGRVSVSNQRIASDSNSNLHNISQCETTKLIGSQDVLLDQNSINLNHGCWNDINLQNSGNHLQSTIENDVHLSSNVIVRTSDIITSSVVSHTGQLRNATKKSYCIKNRDRFIDLTLPDSISSISTNSNNCSTNVMNSNKPTFDSKVHPSSPVQTSVGLQVNFNNPQSECIQNAMSPNNQSTQICTNVSENSTLTNISTLNDQNIINTINSVVSTSSIVNTLFIKENHILDNLKSTMPVVNTVSSIQTQTCMDGLHISNEVSNSNASVISLTIASTQSQVIKTNVHNSLYTTSQNQRVPHADLSHITLEINKSDEQKQIDHLKLVSQTFITTSEAIKFVTSSTESHNFFQSNEKTRTSNLASFPNTTESGVSNINQENNLNSKLTNRGRGSMRTYESKTRALKQANMSDMFVFEKGTLYAAQDDVVNQIEHTKLGISSKNHTMTTQAKIKNTITTKESLEKPKLSTNASPNITITGSMLPRFQQVFGKTKFQTSTIINDTSSLCSTSVISNPSTGPIVNQTNVSMSRVYSSSKGVQTNHEIDQIISNSINCLRPKIVDNKLQQNITMTKSTNAVIDNNKNNVIMTCKTGSSVKNIPEVSLLSTHQTLTSNIDTNNIIKKEFCETPTSEVSTFTTCNNLVASSSSNIINSIPIESESNDNIEKITHTTTHRHLKVPPPIVQTILRRHPNWQQNKFRQGKQSTEVMASSTFERLISSNMLNVTKTTIECSNNKVLVSTIKPNVTESNVSSSMMEQVREFESVLEEVRKTSLMNEMSTVSMLPQINHEIIQIDSPIENVDLLNANSNQTLFPLNEKPNMSNERDHCSFSFLNQTLSNVNDISEEKEPVTAPPTTISVSSVTPVPAETSPTSNISVNPTDGSPQCPNNQIENISNPIINTSANSPPISTVKVPVLQQKPLPKLQEDEQTTQRIYAILDKYAEQLRNSPELKNKPAPRRRTNPPTNPSINTKRKKSNQFSLKSCSQQTSCSSSGMEMSPTSDVQALDSEDSSNAVSHFSHIINSPSGNSDEQNTATVILENPSIENTLLTVHDVINKINIEAEIKSQVSQSTQIVMNGTSGSFLSMPESSAANVRLVVAAGKNQKMYRLHCPVTGPGPVLFQQISSNDSCSNDVKISSNILGQSISESTILSALTSCDLQITNTDLVNEISSNTTSKTPKITDSKTIKPDIILESMEKAQVLDNDEKQLPLYPVMKKSQGSQSTFSVIHSLPKYEPDDTIESLTNSQNNISEDIQNNLHDNIQDGLNVKEETVPLKNDPVVKTLKNEVPICIPPGSSESTGMNFEDLGFPTFQEDKQNNTTNTTDAVKKNNQQKISEVKIEKVICEDGLVIKQEKSFSSTTDGTSNTSDFSNIKIEEGEIKSTHTSNIHKAEKTSGIMKIECESNNKNDNSFSISTYKLLDDQFSDIKNTKFLVQSLKSDKTSKTWTVCLSQIMPSGTEKMLEGENLVRLQELFEQSEIKTFKDFKKFLFEQCKQFDGNVERLKEYNLYDIMKGLSVDKFSPNELFSDIAVIHNLDKSENTNLVLEHTSTSKLMDINNLQVRRKSVLSHTTTSTVITTGAEHAASVACKKNKTKVSFLKQALYNEMHQDANDCESKHFLNGSTKTVFDSMEQIDSGPESPLNTTTADSETCMSEDSTSTISSGTPHYNFRKSKRKNKNFEEDGFIESQVIKRMYRGRAAENNEEKAEIPKISNVKVQTSEQKQTVEKKETNIRRISSRLKNNAKNNQQLSNKSPQMDSPPCRITSTRASLRRVSKRTT
ncbi:Hypothetical protein CINCED_3A025049 [Cinara cedri]|uniref:Uncharacterized protein n=1 Tax=Cinara cedri TaxID=506608 RepID=A0A5E4MZY9_9HEMI|nr:Hypothetical protein CINCED_3A025049 [Cinara cedri]